MNVNYNYLLPRLCAVFGALFLVFILLGEPKKPKYIDLPEEIEVAKDGDTLTVYKTTKDTVYIGFANKRNR